MMRRGLLLLWLLILTGCALDKEESLRKALTSRLYIQETVHFVSTRSCTAAVYSLAKAEFRAPYPSVVSYERALEKIGEGADFLFVIEGASPNEISEGIMSRDLPKGLGLISAGIGPANGCMDARISLGFYRVLMSPQSQLVYMPEKNALLLVYPPERLAFFLRGSV